MAEKVTAGTGWPGPLRNAATINRILEATDYYHREIACGRGKKSQSVEATSAGRIRLKNISGADRRKGEILRVGDYLLTDLTKDLIWHKGELHDGTDAQLAVLLEALTQNEIGPAQILGACPALVNFTHADQRYARPAASNDVLQADALGQVRVLHKGGSGTGEKECIVLLGDGRFLGFGVPPSDIAKGTSGTVNFYAGLGGSEGASGVTVTAWAKGNKLAATKLCTLLLMNNVLYGLPWEC